MRSTGLHRRMADTFRLEQAKGEAKARAQSWRPAAEQEVVTVPLPDEFAPPEAGGVVRSDTGERKQVKEAPTALRPRARPIEQEAPRTPGNVLEV